MASPVKLYQREIYDKFSCFATWLPGDQIAVGDVGIIKRGRFRRQATLKGLKIPCGATAGEKTESFQFESSRGVTIQATPGAAVHQVAGLGVSIMFSQKGAFVFHVSDLCHHRLDEPETVAEHVLKLYNAKARKWNKDWFLVDEVHSAECATIVVSEVRSSSISLDVSAGGLVPGFSLADPKLDLKVAGESRRVNYVLCKAGAQPLYSCVQVRDPLFSDAIVRTRGQPFIKPDIDALLDS
jgi:hypothetical protein